MVLKLNASDSKDWDTLKTSFLEHFKLVLRDSQTRLLEKKVELANLRQGNNAGVAQFVKRAEDLANQIPDSEMDVGMAIIQGMADENGKKRISFECYKDSDFTLKKVKRLIRAAFFEVGKTSLFDSTHQQPLRSASQPSTSDEALRQMVISASTSLPSILQGMRSIGAALQNLDQVPVRLQSAQGGGAHKLYKTRRDLGDIQCYICGEIEHYASAHSGLEIQKPRASGALSPKDFWIRRPGGTREACQEEDEDVMLAAQVSLRNNRVEKTPKKKATKQEVSQWQLRPTYEDPQAYESNYIPSGAIDKVENTLGPDKIQHAMLSVHQKSQHSFQYPDLMQLPRPQMSDPIGEMTQPYVENDNTISMKVTPCITKAVFADSFPRDLESLFLEEDAVSTGCAILKQKSAMIDDKKVQS